MTPSDAGPQNRIARLAGAVGALAGVAVVAGWLTHSQLLKSLVPGFVTMKVNTALAFTFIGGSLVLVASRRHLRVARVLAAAAALIGALTLLEYLAGADLRIDQLLLAEASDVRGIPGRMSPLTAFCLALLGVSLLLCSTGSRTAARAADGLALVGLVVSLVALSGYAYGTSRLYGIGRHTQVALHTAALLVVLSVGLLAARREGGVAALLAGHDAGSVAARRGLPVALALPVLLGPFMLLLRRRGVVDEPMAYALIVITSSMAMALVLFLTARHLNRLDALRRGAEAERRGTLRHAAQAERQRTRTLEELQQLREEFLAIVAHDLRSPILAISLQSEQLLRKAQANEVTVEVASLERIRRSALKLQNMVSVLLDASRVELGQVQIERRAMRVGEAVSALVKEIEPALAPHPVSVCVSEDVPQVLADPLRFDQILTNLLENAAKHSPPDSPVVVSVSREGDGVLVSVSDQGPGIDRGHLERLFDRYFQSDRARAAGKGLGLGLFIAKGLVEAHSGRIWVQSTPGAGSAFHVWLPAGGPEARAPERQAREALGAPPPG